MRTIVIGLVLAACGGGTGDRSTLDTIPRPAAAALTAQAGAATIQHVSRATEGGREVFEAEWSEGGLEREAKVTASGELVELEVEVREADVPASVRLDIAVEYKVAGSSGHESGVRRARRRPVS